ncbi:ATP-binding protein [Sphaerimonospora cavernae]|uniref:ATP-binding protein n=1 Tax=Sphaerimonospora cavernae TaxID=1740611 RepID=A0ABV6U169_9ACTN
MIPGWWQRAFPGEARQLHEVRRYVDGLLTDDCPDRDVVIACVAELASNALTHTRSGNGGTFVVHVQRATNALRIAVVDAGAQTTPAIRVAQNGDLLEGGRGLAIVASLSDQMGVEGDERGRTVWAEFRWPEQQPACPMSSKTDTARALVELGTEFSAWVCWFGNKSHQWWAMPRTSQPLLIAAASAHDLAHQIATIEQNGP